MSSNSSVANICHKNIRKGKLSKNCTKLAFRVILLLTREIGSSPEYYALLCTNSIVFCCLFVISSDKLLSVSRPK